MQKEIKTLIILLINISFFIYPKIAVTEENKEKEENVHLYSCHTKKTLKFRTSCLDSENSKFQNDFLIDKWLLDFKLLRLIPTGEKEGDLYGIGGGFSLGMKNNLSHNSSIEGEIGYLWNASKMMIPGETERFLEMIPFIISYDYRIFSKKTFSYYIGGGIDIVHARKEDKESYFDFDIGKFVSATMRDRATGIGFHLESGIDLKIWDDFSLDFKIRYSYIPISKWKFNIGGINLSVSILYVLIREEKCPHRWVEWHLDEKNSSCKYIGYKNLVSISKNKEEKKCSYTAVFIYEIKYLERKWECFCNLKKGHSGLHRRGNKIKTTETRVRFPRQIEQEIESFIAPCDPNLRSKEINGLGQKYERFIKDEAFKIIKKK